MSIEREAATYNEHGAIAEALQPYLDSATTGDGSAMRGAWLEGAHIVGSDATELLAEYALAMNAELTSDEIHHTIHAHPTMSEALMEAASAVKGEAIHI